MMRWGRSWKAKSTETVKNYFDAGRKGWSDTAVNLLFVQFTSWSVRARRKMLGRRLTVGTVLCSEAWQLYKGWENAAECRYVSQPNCVPSGNWIKVKKINKKWKWQNGAKVLAGEDLQCSISLVLHSMTQSISNPRLRQYFYGWRDLLHERETFERYLDILNWKCKERNFSFSAAGHILICWNWFLSIDTIRGNWSSA